MEELERIQQELELEANAEVEVTEEEEEAVAEDNVEVEEKSEELSDDDREKIKYKQIWKRERKRAEEALKREQKEKEELRQRLSEYEKKQMASLPEQDRAKIEAKHREYELTKREQALQDQQILSAWESKVADASDIHEIEEVSFDVLSGCPAVAKTVMSSSNGLDVIRYMAKNPQLVDMAGLVKDTGGEKSLLAFMHKVADMMVDATPANVIKKTPAPMNVKRNPSFRKSTSQADIDAEVDNILRNL